MLDFIAKFNPYNMDDETVMFLATARKKILHQSLAMLEDNVRGMGNCAHLLIYGPRGVGKSCFLKYLSIHFHRNEVFQHCDFVSFPEEQSNIKCSVDFIRMALVGTL